MTKVPFGVYLNIRNRREFPSTLLMIIYFLFFSLNQVNLFVLLRLGSVKKYGLEHHLTLVCETHNKKAPSNRMNIDM